MLTDFIADEQVLPYLDALTTRLLELLGSADIEVREMVLPALSALAEAADRAFLPYYPKTMELVQAMMNLVRVHPCVTLPPRGFRTS